MIRRTLPLVLTVLLLNLFASLPARADEPGQADLDKATEAKLTAESSADLSDVIKLCRSAIKAGLDKSNADFAGQLLAGTLMQRAELICGEIFDQTIPPGNWPQLRTMALNDLEESLKLDAEQPAAHFYVGRLNSLPGGDAKRAAQALDLAVKLAKDDPISKAKALVSRANLSEDPDQRKADYDEAAKLAPHNIEVIRSRGLFNLQQGKNEEAIADLDAAIAIDPKHADSHEARGVALLLLKRYDEALKSFDKAVELAPNSAVPYAHRARIHALQGDAKAALKELDRALKIEPRSLSMLLLRARIYEQAGEIDKALAEVEHVLDLQPDLTQAVQLHAVLAAGAGKYDIAIADLERLKAAAPGNAELLLQLGMFYSADKKPQKAVETFAEVLKDDAKNWIAYRGRADAYLSTGKQAEAIADYEEALKLQPENTGIMNNLAWVLATSPNEKLRDGKRSIELAMEACKLTQYKQAHILSTLAAGYAESGDFDEAVSWSKKAVEAGADQLKGQLEKELQSYQDRKPWREFEPSTTVDEPQTAESSKGPKAESADVNPDSEGLPRSAGKPDDDSEDEDEADDTIRT